jgi:hypothetical protein
VIVRLACIEGILGFLRRCNHHRGTEVAEFEVIFNQNLLLCVLRGHEKKLICRSLARFDASVFFFLEKIQLRRYYSGANR